MTVYNQLREYYFEISDAIDRLRDLRTMPEKWPDFTRLEAEMNETLSGIITAIHYVQARNAGERAARGLDKSGDMPDTTGT